MEIVEKTLILTDQNGDEMKLDFAHGTTQKQENHLADRFVKRCRNVFAYHDKIIYIPESHPWIGYKEHGEMKKIEFPVGSYEQQPMGTYWLYSFAHLNGNMLYLQSRTDGIIHAFDMETMEESRMEIQPDSLPAMRERIIAPSLEHSKILWEANFARVEDLIQYVLHSDEGQGAMQKSNVKSNVGRNIFSLINFPWKN